jgi:hypothetical protein
LALRKEVSLIRQRILNRERKQDIGCSGLFWNNRFQLSGCSRLLNGNNRQPAKELDFRAGCSRMPEQPESA